MPRKTNRARLIDKLLTTAMENARLINRRASDLIQQSTLESHTLLLLRLAQIYTSQQLPASSSRQKECLAYLFISLIENWISRSMVLYGWLRRSRAEETYLRITTLTLDAIRIDKSRRYLKTRNPRGRPDLRNAIFNQMFEEGGSAFHQLARMSKESFFALLSRIENCEIFLNQSSNSQVPVSWQLLVALANLGTRGNGGCYSMVARTFGISEDIVENYTNRCIYAIIHLQTEFVRWPNEAQRICMKAELSGRTFFEECVGYMDGTIIPLAYAPVLNKEDYWTRKMLYGLKIMLVCDQHTRVLYAHLGWCGSAHDQRVFRASKIHQNPHQFFSRGEYLLTDSDYSPSPTVIPAFKRSRGEQLEPKKQQFNFELSQDRVAAEQCIGMLKSRWQSLKELRVLIRDKGSAKRANAWIMACLTLHNFLLTKNDIWDESNPNFVLPGNVALNVQDGQADLVRNISDDRRRAELFSLFLGRRT